MDLGSNRFEAETSIVVQRVTHCASEMAKKDKAERDDVRFIVATCT